MIARGILPTALWCSGHMDGKSRTLNLQHPKTAMQWWFVCSGDPVIDLTAKSPGGCGWMISGWKKICQTLRALIRKFDDVFLYCFTARFAWDTKAAELNIISFAVEGTAKENSSIFRKVILHWNTGGYFFSPQGFMFLLSAFSAESKKETNSLWPLRLSGDYKLSNYNTMPYLRIRIQRHERSKKKKLKHSI